MPSVSGLAVGAHMRPATSTKVINGRGMPLDPSAADRRALSSKLIIDATRQWPEEGGPDAYPGLNRNLLEELAPDAMPRALNQWGDIINSWGKRDFT